MYAFSHPETEQMKATTDYRYIGNNPNNYVKFNCNNDGENCEIWRIIGVFDVDDGTGKYEQRIKLVRGSAFASTMEWDDYSKNINNWPDADLNIFLNGYYLNRSNIASSYGLTELAQSQIADAKYYLGGRAYESTTHYGSTEDMHSWERENTVYNENGATRSTAWTGKVGLMYPSDYAYTYSSGVDDKCYNDPYTCGASRMTPHGEATTGWIYNSNNLEGQTSNQWIWLLSPVSGDSNVVYDVQTSGNINDSQTYYPGGVRAVVYLKSSINIISREGTEQDPYILG